MRHRRRSQVRHSRMFFFRFCFFRRSQFFFLRKGRGEGVEYALCVSRQYGGSKRCDCSRRCRRGARCKLPSLLFRRTKGTRPKIDFRLSSLRRLKCPTLSQAISSTSMNVNKVCAFAKMSRNIFVSSSLPTKCHRHRGKCVFFAARPRTYLCAYVFMSTGTGFSNSEIFPFNPNAALILSHKAVHIFNTTSTHHLRRQTKRFRKFKNRRT